MPKEPNKKRIGLFVICGFLILAGLTLKFVINKIIPDDKHLVVMYFAESIKGLNVGSSVIFEGVEIGKVAKIELLTDPETLDFSIPVYAKLKQEETFSELSTKSRRSRKDMLEELIQKGLRARLVTQSYLTGQLMIELQMLPNAPVTFRQQEFHGKKADFEIPTALSVSGSLSKEFEDMPIKQIMARTDNVLKELETSLPKILPEFERLGKNLNQASETLTPRADRVLRQGEQALYNVSNAAKAIRNFADYIERHPEAFVYGKGK